MKNDIKKASEVISTMFSGFNSSGLQTANTFLRSWDEIVGERIANHSKVIDVNKGTVIVEVDHPGWSQEIQFKKTKIVQILAGKFPEFGIKNLIIRVATECKTPYVRQESTVGSGVQRVTEEESDCEISESISGDLKEVLERLKASIKKGKQDS